MKIHWTAVYVLWRREMIRYLRAKSRIFGSLAMPVFFLAFLGLGFRRMPVPGMGMRRKPRPRKARKNTGMAREPTIRDLALT